ncbi:phosphatidylinositol transfer protein csr1 [Linderina macrospora]|uniref:Phosphatidylinositol transfer protein csr1 n=1 Tax=Linderina macrospora TaxID=4868 RepID=A0ACC1JE34_9FUNG|nr:phosphatidylinositol transfer protein csr1 [Linderina macrospora]
MPVKSSLVDSYKARTPITDGRVGHLTTDQEQKLKQLWSKLLVHFETTSTKPIAVPNDPFGVGQQACLDDEPATLSQWYAANKSRVEDAKFRTVSDELYLSGKREAVVPKDFKPLFGDKPSERLFRNAFWQAAMAYQHPDTMLLGFLRTRGWDVQRSFDSVVSAIEWRAAHAMDKLMWEGESTQAFRAIEQALEYEAGVDRLGCPVLIVRVRKSVPKEFSKESWEKKIAYTLEHTALVARASNSKSVLLQDMSGFGMSNLDYSASKLTMDMISALYPDIYESMILFASPWIFSGVWKIMSKWLDPALADLIQFTKNIDELHTFIDDDQISVDMGGSMKVNLDYIFPSRQENAKMFDAQGRAVAEEVFVDAVAAFEASTRVWASDMDAPERDRLAAKLHSAVAELDPYIRSRFQVERQGKVLADSKIVG